MTLKRFATEFGMGVDLRGEDHTKAAIRAVKDALYRNSLTVAPAMGKDPSEIPKIKSVLFWIKDILVFEASVFARSEFFGSTITRN